MMWNTDYDDKFRRLARMAQVRDAYEVVMVPCCECGAAVDTREVEDGGGPDGCQLTDGRWVCRAECWDAARARSCNVIPVS